MSGKFATLEPQSIILSAVKRAEDGSGLVIRLINPTDKSVVAKIGLDAGLLGKAQAAQEVDLMEKPLPVSTAKLAKNALSVKVRARGIASVLVRI